MPKSLLALVLLVLLPGSAGAENKAIPVLTPPLAAESLGAVEQLGPPQPHWVWVNDMNFPAMLGGRTTLVDADSGRMLGMLNTGYSFMALTLPTHGKEIYSAETYYARGVRGPRSDVVSIYDPTTLSFIAEISLPPKRASTIPVLNDQTITDDDQFMAVFNLTPAASLSIVNLKTRAMAAEIELPGCVMVYPAGPRRLFSMCADASLLLITLDGSGKPIEKVQSKPFFDLWADPVTEKPVRYRNRWIFVSFLGQVYNGDFVGAQPQFDAPWSMLTATDRIASWRPGGLQHLAVHQTSGRLFSLMHQGGDGSHGAPGQEVWVFDIATHERIQRIELRQPAYSIEVTQDETPLLLTISVETPALEVYSATDGQHLRTITEIGSTPTLLQTPWQAAANLLSPMTTGNDE